MFKLKTSCALSLSLFLTSMANSQVLNDTVGGPDHSLSNEDISAKGSFIIEDENTSVKINLNHLMMDTNSGDGSRWNAAINYIQNLSPEEFVNYLRGEFFQTSGWAFSVHFTSDLDVDSEGLVDSMKEQAKSTLRKKLHQYHETLYTQEVLTLAALLKAVMDSEDREQATSRARKYWLRYQEENRDEIEKSTQEARERWNNLDFEEREDQILIDQLFRFRLNLGKAVTNNLAFIFSTGRDNTSLNRPNTANLPGNVVESAPSSFAAFFIDVGGVFTWQDSMGNEFVLRMGINFHESKLPFTNDYAWSVNNFVLSDAQWQKQKTSFDITESQTAYLTLDGGQLFNRDYSLISEYTLGDFDEISWRTTLNYDVTDYLESQFSFGSSDRTDLSFFDHNLEGVNYNATLRVGIWGTENAIFESPFGNTRLDYQGSYTFFSEDESSIFGSGLNLSGQLPSSRLNWNLNAYADDNFEAITFGFGL